jgi:hypothetical protein
LRRFRDDSASLFALIQGRANVLATYDRWSASSNLGTEEYSTLDAAGGLLEADSDREPWLIGQEA